MITWLATIIEIEIGKKRGLKSADGKKQALYYHKKKKEGEYSFGIAQRNNGREPQSQ